MKLEGVLTHSHPSVSMRWVPTEWFGWWKLARVNCRRSPKWASIGSAQEASVGVKHSSTTHVYHPGEAP